MVINFPFFLCALGAHKAQAKAVKNQCCSVKYSCLPTIKLQGSGSLVLRTTESSQMFILTVMGFFCIRWEKPDVPCCK